MSQCMRSTCCLAEAGVNYRWRWCFYHCHHSFVLLAVEAAGLPSLGERNSEDPGRMSGWCFLARRPCSTTRASFFSPVKWKCTYFLGSLEA